jgi:hypothetical protein
MNKLNLQKVEQMAVDCLEKTGKHSPQIIVETPQGVAMVVLLFRNREEKWKMEDEIRGLVKKSNVDNYFYVAEAWTTQLTKDNPVMSPSRSVDRKEVLMIAEFKRDGSGESIMREFKRKDDKIIWQERAVQKNNEASSSADFFSDPDAVRSKMSEGAFQHNKEYMENFSKQLFKKYGAEFEKCVNKEDEAGFKELMKKIMSEMDKEVTRINLMKLEDPEVNQDDEN